MKTLRYIICTLLLSTLAFACTSDFEKTNSDPNRISKIGPSALLNPIIYNMWEYLCDRSYNQTFYFMQVMVYYPTTSAGLEHYNITHGTSTGIWDNSYLWLANIREMKKASIEYRDVNYTAIANTLEAYTLTTLTDVFGDIPMNEASKGDEGIFYPKFNTQKEVYDTIFSLLHQANELYNTSTSGMIYTEDLLFHNNIKNWQRMSNSLLLRALLRVSSVPSMHADSQMVTILNNPEKYPLISNDDESAILEITGVAPNQSPWPRYQDFSLSKACAEFFIDNLIQLNDPRLPFFARRASDKTGADIGYKGIPSGYLPPENSSTSFPFNPSTPNSEQAKAPLGIRIITYAEIEFIKAELALRNVINEDAETHYKNGVKSAIVLATGKEFDESYFNNENTQYNGTLERILLQKYYALYFTDYQQWFEYRRTGFPKLPLPTGRVREKMPIRFYYPTNTLTFNQKEAQIALDRMGGKDDVDYPAFWDVNTNTH